jgi:predicted metal-dependent hydrolase
VSKVKLFTKTDFPFPYTIKPSKRAKRLSLKVTPEHGVQVVKPEKMAEQRALVFLEQHIDWVQKHAAVWEVAHRKRELPTIITIPSINSSWSVRYDYNPLRSKRGRLLPMDETDLLYIGPDEDKIIFRCLHRWIETVAIDFLVMRLRKLSKQTKLEFNEVIFRKQQTRWGSCSQDKNISLNLKLIFLPAELIDYVLIHELAHTKQMNHGKAFWSLVAEFVPNYKQCVQALKHTAEHIPAWF